MSAQPAPAREIEITEEHMLRARKIAGWWHRRMHFSLPFDDFLSAALLGLAQARKSYRPGRGASFLTFASHRMRGEILDWLRSEYILCDRRVGEAPVFFEIGKLRDAAAPQAPPPEPWIWKHIRDAGLSERDFTILRLHYHDGVPNQELMTRFGVNESRVSQIRNRALRKIRERLDA